MKKLLKSLLTVARVANAYQVANIYSFRSQTKRDCGFTGCYASAPDATDIISGSDKYEGKETSSFTPEMCRVANEAELKAMDYALFGWCWDYHFDILSSYTE